MNIYIYFLWLTPGGQHGNMTNNPFASTVNIETPTVTIQTSIFHNKSTAHVKWGIVLKTQLNSKNRVWAINTYLLVIKYPTDNISWPKEESDATDKETPYHAWRVSPQIRHLETVKKTQGKKESKDKWAS